MKKLDETVTADPTPGDSLTPDQVEMYLSTCSKSIHQQLTAPSFRDTVHAAYENLKVSGTEISGAPLAGILLTSIPRGLKPQCWRELKSIELIDVLVENFNNESQRNVVSVEHLTDFVLFCIAHRMHRYFERPEFTAPFQNGRTPSLPSSHRETPTTAEPEPHVLVETEESEEGQASMVMPLPKNDGGGVHNTSEPLHHTSPQLSMSEVERQKSKAQQMTSPRQSMAQRTGVRAPPGRCDTMRRHTVQCHSVPESGATGTESHKLAVRVGAANAQFGFMEQDLEKHKKHVHNRPHLVMNFDINKTIIMVDTAKGQPISDVLNGILSECSWGEQVEISEAEPVEAGWRLLNDEPSVMKPRHMVEEREKHNLPPVISYLEYLKMRLPGKNNKKQVEQLYKSFTEPGKPGEGVRSCYDRMQQRIIDGCGSSGGGSTKRSILSSFFNLAKELVNQERTFSVVFRTFGKDLPRITEEFNEFCMGNHPNYPDCRFDGSNESGLDLRIVPENIGSWYRDDNRIAIVWGTTSFEEDLKAAGGKLEDYMGKPENAHLRLSDGGEAAYAAVRAKTSNSCTVALRDYWPYWHKKGERGQYGKALFVDPKDTRRLDIFFDDCIHLGEEDTHIVDVRQGDCGLIWPVYAHKHYLCRAEPFHAILDEDYFLKKLQEKEAVHFEKLKFRRRLRQMLRSVMKRSVMLNILQKSRTGLLEDAKRPHDAWASQRLELRSSLVSRIHCFGDSHDDSDDSQSDEDPLHLAKHSEYARERAASHSGILTSNMPGL